MAYVTRTFGSRPNAKFQPPAMTGLAVHKGHTTGQDRIRGIYIYISVPLILSFCLSFMQGQTSHGRRLKICMWPHPMGAGDIGHMRSASAASEAVS